MEKRKEKTVNTYGTFSPEHSATILDSITDGVFTVDLNWRITSFNRAAEQITNISRKEALGKRCCDVFRASICGVGMRSAEDNGHRKTCCQ